MSIIIRFHRTTASSTGNWLLSLAVQLACKLYLTHSCYGSEVSGFLSYLRDRCELSMSQLFGDCKLSASSNPDSINTLVKVIVSRIDLVNIFLTFRAKLLSLIPLQNSRTQETAEFLSSVLVMLVASTGSCVLFNRRAFKYAHPPRLATRSKCRRCCCRACMWVDAK